MRVRIPSTALSCASKSRLRAPTEPQIRSFCPTDHRPRRTAPPGIPQWPQTAQWSRRRSGLHGAVVLAPQCSWPRSDPGLQSSGGKGGPGHESGRGASRSRQEPRTRKRPASGIRPRKPATPISRRGRLGPRYEFSLSTPTNEALSNVPLGGTSRRCGSRERRNRIILAQPRPKSPTVASLRMSSVFPQRISPVVMFTADM